MTVKEVVIIEPFLKNQSGHQFSYTVALSDELRARGIAVSILAHEHANFACLGLENCRPCFCEVTSTFFQSPLSIASISVLIRKIKTLSAQCSRVLLDEYALRSKQDVVLFIHSLYIFELLAIGFFLRKHAAVLKRQNHTVCIGFNFEYRRQSRLLTSVLICLYRFFRFLTRRIRHNIRYCSDSALLAREYTHVMRTPVRRLPVPLVGSLTSRYLGIQHNGSTSGTITVGYIGGARHNKGFDLFVNMVEQVAQQDAGKKIRFKLQVDMHALQSSNERRSIENTLRQLELLRQGNTAVQPVYGPLAIDEYYMLLSELDIVCFAYRPYAFRSVPSQVFREAIIFGKIPVVSAKTTMARVLEEADLSDCIFDSSQSGAFEQCVKKVVENLGHYRAQLKPLQQKMREDFSSKALADQLIGLIRSPR